uniref:Steroid 17-alpha-hydroxylase/17,20 lyase-like n=1 Tax=Callorhinchus milii TaxID=7868 RepID=A0A4W3GZD3_CALMI
MGPCWRRQRHLLYSASTGARTEGSLCQEAEALCCQVLARGDEGFDPDALLTGTVTNVICRLVFGSSYRPGDTELETVMACINGIAETAGNSGLVDTFPWLQIFPNQKLKKLRESVRIRDELLTRKLREHQATLCPGQSRDLLDALLHDQQAVGGAGGEAGRVALTEDHVLMTAADAFGAGVETTATTLRWAIAFLLHHPEVLGVGGLGLAGAGDWMRGRLWVRG